MSSSARERQVNVLEGCVNPYPDEATFKFRPRATANRLLVQIAAVTSGLSVRHVCE